MDNQIKVLLIDDQELFRHGLRHILEPEKDIEVVGECTSAEEAFSQLGVLYPDIMLMDIHMPGTDGIEATRRLKGSGLACHPDIIILADSADYQGRALEAGAAGYLLKDVKSVELVQTIRRVYRNNHPMEERRRSAEKVELVIPLPHSAARLSRFIDQVEKTLDASILQTVGSWDWGTAITLLLEAIPLADVLDKIRSMPDVEKVEDAIKVEEELPVKSGLSGLPRKLRTLPRPKKRIRITLSQTGLVRQRPQSALHEAQRERVRIPRP